MSLTPIQFVIGALSLTFMILSLFIGILIISKYFEFKKKLLLLVGFTWVIMSELWWSSSISFLVALVNDVGLPDEVYFLLGNLFVPVALFCWITAFTEMKYKKYQRHFQLIFIIVGGFYYFIFLYFISMDVANIGTMRGPVDGVYTPLALVFLLTGLFTFVITGFIFAMESRKAESEETRFKGTLLYIAFICFLIGGGLDGIKPFLFAPEALDIVEVITRIFLIVSAFAFYWGFTLPTWLKKLFIK